MLYKILKYPFFGRYMVKWRNPIPENQRKAWKSVRVKSKSGGVIQGLLIRTLAQHPKATIVLGHPMGKEAKGYFIKRGYIKFLTQAGYHVLIFDINGFGESTNGNFSFFEDIIAIGKEGKRLTPDLPLGYFGISLGGQWAILAFVDDNHPYEFAIVESAATTLREFWQQFPAAYRILNFMGFFLPRYERKIEFIDRIKEIKHVQSLLFIHAKTDALVPYEMSERFVANSPVPTELWAVPEAVHAEVMKSTYKEAYQQKILSYFDSQCSKIQFLKQPPP